MRRQILDTLSDWKTDENRKVLLLRGTRQVGKTYIVRELAKKFKHFVEINFEKNTETHSFFDQNLDPERICTNLSAYFRIPILKVRPYYSLTRFKAVRKLFRPFAFSTNPYQDCM